MTTETKPKKRRTTKKTPTGGEVVEYTPVASFGARPQRKTNEQFLEVGGTAFYAAPCDAGELIVLHDVTQKQTDNDALHAAGDFLVTFLNARAVATSRLSKVDVFKMLGEDEKTLGDNMQDLLEYIYKNLTKQASTTRA